MTAGLGRPLILTTLETDEAMRILAGGTGRPRFAAACIAVGAGLVVAGVAWAGVGAVASALAYVGGLIVPVALAASPTQATGGDPRSSGEGPGLVGEPGLALLAVVAIGIVSIVATTVWIRFTADRSTRPTPTGSKSPRSNRSR
jgi:hypothetical protein